MHRINNDLNQYAGQKPNNTGADLIGNPKIQRFMRTYGVDEHFILQHSLKFKKWLEAVSVCDGCRSLRDCRQKINGTCMNLEVDDSGTLEQTYASCRLIKAEDRKYSFRKNFVYSTLDNNDYSVRLQEIGSSRNTMQSMSLEYYVTFNEILDSFNRRNSEDRGLYLYGPPGTGKTYMLTAMANEFARDGWKIAFVSWPVFTQDYRANFEDSAYKRKQMSLLKNCDLLIIDDLGAEYSTAFSRDEILLPVLEYRMIHHKKTYFSSNYDILTLKEVYSGQSDKRTVIAVDRLIDRIRALSKEQVLKGKSHRY